MSFLKRLFGTQRGKSLRTQSDSYYNLLDKIEKARRNNNLDSVFMYSQMSLCLIDGFIKFAKSELGGFDVVSIPALEEGFLIAVIKGLSGQMQNFKEVVANFPELEPWKEKFNDIEKLRSVVEYIKKHSGCLQKDLKNIFPDIERYLVGKCLYYLTLLNIIKKEKYGSTNKLFWL